MIRLLIVGPLILAGLLCLVLAWLNNRRYTRELDKYGRDWNCPRWPHETNNSYHARLRARIGFR